LENGERVIGGMVGMASLNRSWDIEFTLWDVSTSMRLSSPLGVKYKDDAFCAWKSQSPVSRKHKWKLKKPFLVNVQNQPVGTWTLEWRWMALLRHYFYHFDIFRRSTTHSKFWSWIRKIGVNRQVFEKSPPTKVESFEYMLSALEVEEVLGLSGKRHLLYWQ